MGLRLEEPEKVLCTIQKGAQVESHGWHDSLDNVRSASHGTIVYHKLCSKEEQTSKKPRLPNKDRAHTHDAQVFTQLPYQRARKESKQLANTDPKHPFNILKQCQTQITDKLQVGLAQLAQQV